MVACAQEPVKNENNVMDWAQQQHKQAYSLSVIKHIIVAADLEYDETHVVDNGIDGKYDFIAWIVLNSRCNH